MQGCPHMARSGFHGPGKLRCLCVVQLAPGGHLGRFIIWTRSAFDRLDEVFGEQPPYLTPLYMLLHVLHSQQSVGCWFLL